MEATRNVWLDATKYKPSDIQDYITGEFLVARIIYVDYTDYEFDIVNGWYNSYKEEFTIPERFVNKEYGRYVIKDFCVLPKLEW